MKAIKGDVEWTWIKRSGSDNVLIGKWSKKIAVGVVLRRSVDREFCHMDDLAEPSAKTYCVWEHEEDLPEREKYRHEVKSKLDAGMFLQLRTKGRFSLGTRVLNDMVNITFGFRF